MTFCRDVLKTIVTLSCVFLGNHRAYLVSLSLLRLQAVLLEYDWFQTVVLLSLKEFIIINVFWVRRNSSWCLPSAFNIFHRMIGSFIASTNKLYEAFLVRDVVHLVFRSQDGLMDLEFFLLELLTVPFEVWVRDLEVWYSIFRAIFLAWMPFGEL